MRRRFIQNALVGAAGIASLPLLQSFSGADDIAVYYTNESKAASLDRFYNVLNFGAKGDGGAMDTKAIQEAIEKAAQDGGGTVYFPAGKYISGTLFMKSNVNLHLGAGAIIAGSKDLSDYPEIQTGFRFYAENYVNRALIHAYRAENIGIRGDGKIDGQGNSDEFYSKKYKIRPYVLWFVECKKVTVKEVELRSSPMWMQYYLGCDDVRLENLKIHNHGNHNNDMIDIDGCHNVIIKGITGDSDDDGITFKSTYGRISET